MAAVKRKKPPGPSVKNFLASPYLLNWPTLDRGDNKSILDGIRRIFPPLRLKREAKEQIDDNSSETALFVTWEIIKKCLVIGVNEVTKALEKDKLMLVLVCKSTKPSILTNHLIFLSATRSTPACGLFGLSEVMASLLGIKTVAACGFKKDITVQILKDLVEFIVCKIPPLSCFGLKMWSESSREERDQNTAHSSQLHSQPGDQPIDGSKICGSQDGAARKREDVSVGGQSKRSFDSSFVETHIKKLLSSGKTKVKKNKIKKLKE